jgi:hypothetical protein
VNKLLLLALASLLTFSPFGVAYAAPATLEGVVWFSEAEGEHAACVNVDVYSDNTCETWIGGDFTWACGNYEVGGLIAGETYYVTVWFGAIGCTGASWSGTCPETTLYCQPVTMREDTTSTNKDWDLGLDDCENNSNCP